MLLAGCNGEVISDESSVESSDESQTAPADFDLSALDLGFSDRDETADYKQNEVKAPQDSGERIEITSEGTYILSGEITKTVYVSVGEQEKVQLLLDNASISNQDGPCIYIASGDKVFITLKDGTKNSISDGSDYTLTDGDTNIDGAVFSRADLTVNGSGSLTVNGNSGHAIVSKDDLRILNATLAIKSAKVGLNGKDCVKIKNATLTVDAGSDGIRSDNSEDSTKGFVYIASGSFDIKSGNDGIQAETALIVDSGEVKILSGGGSGNRSYDSEESAKGLKGNAFVSLTGGKFSINSLDDCVHSNGSITVSGGELELSTSDDGIHADNVLSVTNGNININQSYEGLEATTINLSGGDIRINASDDGLNAAGGNDGSTDMNPSFGGQRPEQGGMTPPDGNPQGGMTPPDGNGMGNMAGGTPPDGGYGGGKPSGGRPDGGYGGGSFGGGKPGMDMFGGGTGELNISGGKIIISASGDGIDSNGGITVTGGVTLVSGPTNNGNGSIDAGGEVKVTGGVLVALGSSGMAVGFSSAENQGAIIQNISSQSGGTLFALCDSDNNVIVSFAPMKAYSNVVVTAPELQSGESYKLVVGGDVADADGDGYSRNTTISGGTTLATIDMTSLLYGSSGGMGRPR